MIYEFHYPHANVTQKKILIKHEDYLLFKELYGDNQDEIKRKKNLQKTITQEMEWFTEKSPLFDAIETGILNCNGTFQCQVTKL